MDCISNMHCVFTQFNRYQSPRVTPTLTLSQTAYTQLAELHSLKQIINIRNVFFLFILMGEVLETCLTISMYGLFSSTTKFSYAIRKQMRKYIQLKLSLKSLIKKHECQILVSPSLLASSASSSIKIIENVNIKEFISSFRDKYIYIY